VSISPCVFCHLDFLWKSFLQFICWFLYRVIDFLGSLIVWASCTLQLLIFCQMYTWQRFYHILWAAFSIWWQFVLLCRKFLISVVFFIHPTLSCWTIWILLRKSMPMPIISNFKVSGLILRSLIYFELILVQADRHGCSFSFLPAHTMFSQQHFLKRLSFLHHMFLAPL
jgi:hypothetical protein